MSSYLQMQQLAQNPAAVQTLAQFLLSVTSVGWTEWEENFLHDMASRTSPDAISTRQREKLVELRDDAQNYSKFKSFSVAGLVRDCWIARFDLSEDDEAFIDGLKTNATTSLKKRPVLRLLRIARELGLISGFVDLN